MESDRTLKSFYPVIMGILVITGMTGLIYQVAWQKYLTYLIGSESRSSALVIAMFLAGLAAGNAYFARYAQRETNRKKIINAYAGCEALIGAYALIFPTIFDLISPIIWSLSPANGILNSIVHLLLTFILVFPPTFFMGSTITLLTKAIPDSLTESSYFHARIYGINTVGAFIGVILSAMLIFPVFGLRLGLTIFGLVNLLCALILATLPIQGETIDAKQDSDHYEVQNTLGNKELMTISFFCGLIVIAVEVLTIRLFSLATGPTHLAYPLIVGLFILALARGSLSVKRSGLQILRKTLWQASFFLAVFFAGVPFWPYWFSNIRASLTDLEGNYYVYYSAIFILLILIASPAIYFLGRLLPLSYSLMKKEKEDYAKLVGKLYVVNTMGTLIGALIPGHYLLALVDIPEIFAFFGLLVVLYSTRVEVAVTKQKYRWSLASLCLLMILSLQWNRASHHISPYNVPGLGEHNFKGLFSIPNLIEESDVLFFKDGPNTSVTVLENKKLDTRSIIVNGKSDGSTGEPDLSTVTLLSLLPYLSLPDDATNLKTSVIGLGTGITPGILASLERVKSVETLEIAPMVIKAGDFFEGDNYHLQKNPKSKIINQDAFSFYGPRVNEFDLIISEPSNPWLSGVENLYSSSFYKLAARSLKENGILTQWLHTYHMNERILASIFENLLPIFKHITLYKTSKGDIALLSSQKPITFSTAHANEPMVKEALKKIGVQNPASLPILHYLDQKGLFYVTLNNNTFTHDLHTPVLQHFSSKSFFMRERIQELHTLLNPYHARFINANHADRHNAFKLVVDDEKTCKDSHNHYYCQHLTVLRNWWNKYKDEKNVSEKMKLYAILRKEDVIMPDLELLRRSKEGLTGNSKQITAQLTLIIDEWLKENNREGAMELLEYAKKNYPEAVSDFWIKKSFEYIDQKLIHSQKIQSLLSKKL